MKKFGLAVLVSVIAAVQVGCAEDSGGSQGGGAAGGPPDFAALENKLTQPTGTFSSGQEGSVADGFGSQSDSAQNNPFGGGSSGTSSQQSAGEIALQTLQPLESSNSTCPGLQQGGKGSCACPNGGTLDYDVPANVTGRPGEDAQGSIDQTVSLVAHTCGTEADQMVDGSIYWKIKSPPPMQLFSVHLKLSGRQTARYDVDYLNKNGVVTFAVDVADGRVLVSAKGSWDKKSKTGTLVITDKSDTWTCTLTNGKGTCTSAAGATRNVG